MIEQEPVEQEEAKPEPAQTPDEPGPIGTALTGNGPGDGFGLSGGSGLGGIGGGSGGGKKGGSRFGWYAGKVQTSVADALRRNGKTQKASMNVSAKIWVDSNGRVTRATGSSGEIALGDVLTGLQFSEPPPADMPMPINLRITAKRPN